MLLLALHVHAPWLASWGMRPHCAIFSQLLELELLLQLALLAFDLVAWIFFKNSLIGCDCYRGWKEGS